MQILEQEKGLENPNFSGTSLMNDPHYSELLKTSKTECRQINSQFAANNYELSAIIC